MSLTLKLIFYTTILSIVCACNGQSNNKEFKTMPANTSITSASPLQENIGTTVIKNATRYLSSPYVAHTLDKEIEKKVDSLLKKMTLDEKIGQMNQYNGFWDVTGPVPNNNFVQQKYADLTDDDLLYEEGKEDELFGRLQQKIGQTKEQITKWYNEELK